MGSEERGRAGCWPVFIGTAGHQVGNVAMSQILVVMSLGVAETYRATQQSVMAGPGF